MFSLENFYYILYTNLFKPANCKVRYFYPFGSVDSKHLMEFVDQKTPRKRDRNKSVVFMYDQEPLLEHFITNLNLREHISDHYTSILVNSEYSTLKHEICQEYNMSELYYFFHGFAALIWYRDYKYIPPNQSKVKNHFISLNHLTTDDRSYRLNLVSHYIEKDILKFGLVSLHNTNEMHWENEVSNVNSKLTCEAKKRISENLPKVALPLIADNTTVSGALSAATGPNEITLYQSALWHVVSETVFYYPKLHLTEKIFRPIVNRRPFLLVAAPGNLAYLKNYGFKTFDQWIDESYDLESNDEMRIKMITDELEKICKLSINDLEIMQEEMNEILEYNFQHFYGEFKTSITKEFLNNFKSCAAIADLDIDSIDFNHVETLLLS